MVVNRESTSLARFRPYLADVAAHPALAGGEVLTRNSVTMFVDIAGFTGLSARLARFGTAGTEQLGGVVRQVIGGALDIVARHGGDALAFGGDAITVEFSSGLSPLGAAGLAGREVIELVESASGASTLAGPLDLTVRAGISGGRISSFVRPATTRHVLVHLGPGLDRAVGAAERAPMNQVAVDELELPGTGLEQYSELPGWAPRLFHPLTASRIADAAEPPAEHRRLTAAFLSLPAVDDLDRAALGMLGGFVSRAADAIADAGGDILQCTGGDKGIVLVAVFGAPVAHPDDAARAVYAVDRLRATTSLPFTAGVSSGLAFTATFGGAGKRFVSALGDTVNVAARIMAAAEPDSTLIDGRTAAAVDRRAVVDERRLISVKNRSEPVQVARLRGWARPVLEFEDEGETPLVGREPELAAAEALLGSTARTGGALHFVGDAGSGKSRLIGEIGRRAQVRGMAVRTGTFEAFGMGRPMGPFAAFVRNRPGRPPIVTDDDLAAEIAQVRPGDESLAPLLGPLLDLGEQDTAATIALTEDQRAEVGRRLIVDLLCATVPPTLMVLDDLHWADEASLRLLDDVVANLPRSRVSVVTARRPKDIPGCEPVLVLAELPDARLATIVRDTWGRLGGSELPQAYVDTLVERASGSPMFAQTVTELVRRGYQPGRPLPDVPLPDELLPFLTARLDTLGDSAQATALRMAVLGRPAAPTELVQVFRCDAVGTGADLARLTDAGIVRSIGGDGESLVWVRHATVAEALVTRASHAVREPLHELVCRHLIDTNASPREIAGQLEHCRIPEVELSSYRAARREASAAWALGEARHWAELAVAVARADESASDAIALAELEQQLGEHLLASQRLVGLTGPDAERLIGRIAFETGRPAEAVTHLERAERAGASGPGVTWPLTMALCELGRYEDARSLSLRQLATAGSHDKPMRLDALANLGVVEFREGDIPRAAEILDEARTLAAELGDVLRLANVTGDLAGARFVTGQTAEAVALLSEAAALAERLGARRLVAMALGNAALVRFAAGDRHGAERAAVASANALLGLDDIGLALNSLQVPIDVAEVDGFGERAANWWRKHALLEERLGRPDVSVVSWFRHAALVASLGDVVAATQAIDRAEAAAEGLDTEDVGFHRGRAHDAMDGRYTLPPEAVEAPIDLPPLDADLPEVTPAVVDGLFGRVDALLTARESVPSAAD